MFAHLNPQSSDFWYICALHSPFWPQLTVQSSVFEPGHLRPCPSYIRRRGRIDLGFLRSFDKGGRGTLSLSLLCAIATCAAFQERNPWDSNDRTASNYGFADSDHASMPPPPPPPPPPEPPHEPPPTSRCPSWPPAQPSPLPLPRAQVVLGQRDATATAPHRSSTKLLRGRGVGGWLTHRRLRGITCRKEQRAKSKEQRAKSKEQRAKSKEQRAAFLEAVAHRWWRLSACFGQRCRRRNVVLAHPSAYPPPPPQRTPHNS